MNSQLLIRPVNQSDFASWIPLWDGYNAFYGRHGTTALDANITQSTWKRFLDSHEPMHAYIAEQNGHLVGLVHFIFHRSTSRLNNICYLQDLFVDQHVRGKGIGGQLIHAVYQAAMQLNSSRVYWQTQINNDAGRSLYNKHAQHLGFIVYTNEL